MGVKGLNRFITTNCKKGIKEMNIYQLKNRKIAVDINMYLYQYKLYSTLIEGLYELMITLENFQITPIFIFDGDSPAEKQELLSKNKENKLRAEKKYYSLKRDGKSGKQLENLKKKFLRLTTDDMNQAKELIEAYGYKHYTAEGEAEQLCAKMVKINLVYACLSEDSDLFLYGCPRTLKKIDLNKCSITMYDLNVILYELNLTLDELKEMAVLCGTDYNFELAKYMNIYQIHELFKKYCEKKNVNNKKKTLSFYDYLINNKNNYKIEDFCKACSYQNYYNIIFMFSTDNINTNNLRIDLKKNVAKDINRVKNILKQDNFIYV
jgi:5'-3' exonuclease